MGRVMLPSRSCNGDGRLATCCSCGAGCSCIACRRSLALASDSTSVPAKCGHQVCLIFSHGRSMQKLGMQQRQPYAVAAITLRINVCHEASVHVALHHKGAGL